MVHPFLDTFCVGYEAPTVPWILTAHTPWAMESHASQYHVQ